MFSAVIRCELDEAKNKVDFVKNTGPCLKIVFLPPPR